MTNLINLKIIIKTDKVIGLADWKNGIKGIDLLQKLTSP